MVLGCGTRKETLEFNSKKNETLLVVDLFLYISIVNMYKGTQK